MRTKSGAIFIVVFTVCTLTASAGDVRQQHAFLSYPQPSRFLIAPSAPDLPYVTFIEGGATTSQPLEILKACQYPNVRYVVDKNVRGLPSPTDKPNLEKSLAAIADKHSNHLVLFINHAHAPNGKYSLSGKEEGKGDEYVRAMQSALKSAKDANILLETCHSGACRLRKNIGCTSGPDTTSFCYAAGKNIKFDYTISSLFASILCHANMGDCRYFYDKEGKPTFDKNGDGVLRGNELTDMLRTTWGDEKVLSCEEFTDRAGLSKTHQKLEACYQEKLKACAPRNETNYRIKPKTNADKVKISGAIHLEGISGQYVFHDDFVKPKLQKFQNRSTVVFVSVLGKDLSDAKNNLKKLEAQVRKDPVSYLSRVKYGDGSKYQLDRFIADLTIPKHAKTILEAHKYEAALTPPTIKDIKFTQARVASQVMSVESLERRVVCQYFGARPAGKGKLQIPEVRGLELKVPRCASKNRRFRTTLDSIFDR